MTTQDVMAQFKMIMEALSQYGISRDVAAQVANNMVQQAQQQAGANPAPSTTGESTTATSPVASSRLGFSGTSDPLQAAALNSGVMGATGKDYFAGRNTEIDRALQNQTSQAALSSMLSNPLDIGGQGYINPKTGQHSQGAYSNEQFWSQPNVYVPQRQAEEQQYSQDLATARARWMQQHQHDPSTSMPSANMPEWLKDTAVAPTYEKEAALKWRLGETPSGGHGNASYYMGTPAGGFNPYQ